MTLQQALYAVTIAEKGSFNAAANELLVSQSCLSSAVRELEKEFHITLFIRTNRGVSLTGEGEVFLGYAKQILEQYRLLVEKYGSSATRKRKFSVSLQHYTFAVQAFMRTIARYRADDYEFAIYETKTIDVVDDVKNLKSEIGVLYLDSFNRDPMTRVFHDAEVEFVRLFDCPISVYLARKHPLANRPVLNMEDLAPFPCLSFQQGSANAFYLAEEVMSSYPYRQIIKASDRATMLNLMIGCNGYTLCSGVICEDLNGDLYQTVPLETKEKMTIGYIKKKQIPLSEIGEVYVQELGKFGE
ncbi:MAG: LysR family transcriptional regulator [Thermoguttaceae bacterium]|nr:LysR family transcriptional regulator [Thermoguttaceae bacterium]